MSLRHLLALIALLPALASAASPLPVKPFESLSSIENRFPSYQFKEIQIQSGAINKKTYEVNGTELTGSVIMNFKDENLIRRKSHSTQEKEKLLLESIFWVPKLPMSKKLIIDLYGPPIKQSELENTTALFWDHGMVTLLSPDNENINSFLYFFSFRDKN